MRSRDMRLVASVCLYVYLIHVYVAQKTDCLRSYFLKNTRKKYLVSVIYCSLVKYNNKKGGSLHQTICSGKEIRKHSINGKGEEFRKIVLGKPRLVYMNAIYYAR